MSADKRPERGAAKFARLPIRIDSTAAPLPKPDWLKVRAPSDDIRSQFVRRVLRQARLSTICREAACPNIGECFAGGTAAFLVMGSVCTRRCPFCDVAHGRPEPLDTTEPERLAQAAQRLGLKYVVVTSVNRDDLPDGGAGHFAKIARALRNTIPNVSIEILTPDFKGRSEKALEALSEALPDVFNHNIETVPSLYKLARPGADYAHSLKLLEDFSQRFPGIPTKSGLMLGLGETDDEVEEVLADLLDHGVSIVTIGQYLAPTQAHLPVHRYVAPQTFELWRGKALAMGFQKAFAGVFVRSSYHAADLL